VPTSTPVPADLPSPLLLVSQPSGVETPTGLNLRVVEGGVRLPDNLISGQK
jgi:hypothetical protein